MNDDELAQRSSDVVARANTAVGLLEVRKKDSDKNAAIARAHAAKVRESAIMDARRAFDSEVKDAEAKARELVQRLAPGALSAQWDEPGLLDREVEVLAVAQHVRCGSLSIARTGAASLEIPLILPLLDRGNIVVSARGDRRGAAAGAVQEIVLRSLLGTGAGQLSVLTFDPKLSATMALFSPLRTASEEVMRASLSTPEELRAQFESIARDVRRISDMYGGVPQSLGDFRRSTGQPIEHYQLVTILDYPTGFDEQSNELLLTLLRTGPTCGISFIIHVDEDAAVPRGVDRDAVDGLATTLDLNANVFDTAPTWSVKTGSAPSQALVEPALASLTARIRNAAAPRIDFLDLQPEPKNSWSNRSIDRVTSIIGRIGHQPIEITLGDEIEQKHNVLVTGAVGQGKSNLLMALIHSWAMRYSPDEIELYLLDFKDGVGFYPLAAHGENDDWLPHARVLGLESDRPFGLAVLEHIVGEFQRRASIIKPFGDNISRYRAEQPDAVMPRIMVVIDEFQVLFEEDDETTTAALLALERLARRGRAYGIHLVLASQTLSGITALLAKQDGIFSQFPIRLALYNSAAESRAVLSPNNSEAARLRYRGEVIVNKDFGEIDANQRGVVAFAEPESLRVVRSNLVMRSDRRRPTTFTGSAPAELHEFLPLSREAGVPIALLGLKPGVEPSAYTMSFDYANGRHLSILGTGKRSHGRSGDAAADALQAAAASLATSAAAGSAHFIVLNLLGKNDPTHSVVHDLVSLVTEYGHTVALVDAGEVSAALHELQQELAQRQQEPSETQIFVIGFGMDRLPQARTFNLVTGTAPIDGLVSVWKDGGPCGVHVLGWWSNMRIYKDHVGLDAQGLIDATVVFKIPADGVIDVYGPFFSWSSPDNRAAVCDISQDSAPTVVVPFAPTSMAHLNGHHRAEQPETRS